jgi:DNA polymerase-3 subunit gamma/tau
MRDISEVLARKYRPKNFDELIGQESITQTLSLALDTNRLSHAYLFSGLRGSGKTSTARIFAKALICEEGLSHNPCGVCQNCIMALENRHVDIIEMDGASSRKIDDIRDLIEQTKYKPSIARYKIFIIDEVHMLTKEAFNALLKTLEEPPEYVKFILATTDPLKLPATILSRTQHFRFKSIAPRKIVEHLIHILNLEGIEYEKDALEILARSGGGSLRDSLTLLDQAIIYSKSHVDVLTVTDMLGLVDPQFIAELFSAVFAKDYEKLVEYTKILQDYEAEMVVDELIAYLKEKLFEHDAHFSTLVIDRFFRILSDSKSMFAINADGSFVLSLIFFKMVEALKIKEIDQMIESMQKEVTLTPLSRAVEPLSITQAISADMEKIVHKPVEGLSIHSTENKEFIKLQEMISDRNYELGECFLKAIKFISYKDNVLTWESCADEECKKALKHGYGVIRQFVREIYGFETKIKGVLCRENLHSSSEQKEQQHQNLQPILDDEPQSASMIEDVEIGGSASCVAGCSSEDERKEIDPQTITSEPIVKKAIELFEASKITVQSKI